MRVNRDPQRGENRNYIPNDDIDREEKADLRQQKKGSVFGIIMGGIIILTLIAFLFVLMDSGILSSGAHPIYGNPNSQEGSGDRETQGQLTQEEKKMMPHLLRLVRPSQLKC